MQLGGDPPQVLEVLRLAVARAVQVDHVQRLGPGLHEAAGRLQRVVRVHGLAVEVALLEAHRPPVADVDRGQEDHAARLSAPAQIPAKLRSTRSPFAPDFSGWNCTPYSGARSMAVVNSAPYVATPSTSSSRAGRGA